MELSRRFRALGRVAAFFGGIAGVVGTGVSMLLGTPFFPSLLGFGVMFGSVGVLAGLGVGIVMSQLESGRRLESIPTWRVSAWGSFGGFSPVAMISGLALVSSATAGIALPLLAVGAVCGLATGVFAASVSLATKSADLAAVDGEPSRILALTSSPPAQPMDETGRSI